MRSSISLGRIAGVQIGLNWTWLVIFGLIVLSLGAEVFPTGNPGQSDAAYAAMAFAAAILFCTSLVLHEVGHAVVARREGMEIEGITLWLFGGVAKFKGMFPSPGAAFRIAIAGPIVTLVLGTSFLLGAWLLPLPASVDGVITWLGYVNAFLLGFNLLPALPLDGGRVLRATIWHLRGDFAQATRFADGLGRMFGQMMVALGLARRPARRGPRFRALAAVPRADWDRVRVADRMEPLEQSLVLDRDGALADALPELVRSSLGRAIVRSNGHPAGLLTLTDVQRLLELRELTGSPS